MENKKVKNAQQCVYNGIQFRSRMELKFAMLCDANLVPYEYESLKLILMPKFEYMGRKFRDMTYTPDFVIGKHLVEIKGFATSDYMVKRKIIANHLKDTEYQWHEVKTVKDMNALINQLRKEL